MTDNRHRAAEVQIAQWGIAFDDLTDRIAEALDAAEARGRTLDGLAKCPRCEQKARTA